MILFHANDLLDHQILKHGSFNPAYIPGSMTAAIREIVGMIRHTVNRKKIKIRCQLSKIIQYRVMSFDKRRLQQVLINLLSNAIKFQDKGLITVKAKLCLYQPSDEEIYLVVTVKDQGIGMTSEEVSQVFDHFNRSRNSISRKMNPHGNGIGLSICKQICNKLDGDIKVKSVKGTGSTFVFAMKVFFIPNADILSVDHADTDDEEEKESAEPEESSDEEFSVGGLANKIEERNVAHQRGYESLVFSFDGRQSASKEQIEPILSTRDNNNLIMFQGLIFDLKNDILKPKAVQTANSQIEMN